MKASEQFYSHGDESSRLLRNAGVIEFDRCKEIISRHLTTSLEIMDVGGGDGIYSRWLAKLGHNVRLFDLSPSLIQYAKEFQINDNLLREIAIADARSIPASTASCDLALLMGPLYHLELQKGRIAALTEVSRVLKPGGIVIASSISRYGSLLKAVQGYGTKYNTLIERDFQKMIIQEIKSGIHKRPRNYPHFFPSAHYHSPDELRSELELSGFTVVDVLAVEGPFWQNENIVRDWENEKANIMKLLSHLEKEAGIINTSLHLICVGKKNEYANRVSRSTVHSANAPNVK